MGFVDVSTWTFDNQPLVFWVALFFLGDHPIAHWRFKYYPVCMGSIWESHFWWTSVDGNPNHCFLPWPTTLGYIIYNLESNSTNCYSSVSSTIHHGLPSIVTIYSGDVDIQITSLHQPLTHTKCLFEHLSHHWPPWTMAWISSCFPAPPTTPSAWHDVVSFIAWTSWAAFSRHIGLAMA